MAVGLVLIFGLRRVVNFAHGSLFMIGAYIGFSAAAVGGFWLGLLTAVVILAVIGVALDIGVFRPLPRHDPLVAILVTCGISMVLEDVAQATWGKAFRTVRVPDVLSGSVSFECADFPIYRLAVIVVAALVAIGLTVWLRTSRIGLYVRASSVDPVTAAT